jgi:hypothetical protein
MDKNKAAYKLQNIPPIYYLNIDGQPERRQYVEEHFKYWEIENYTRISAYDGRDDDLSDIIKGRYPESMTSGEVGCTTSHLKAIKHSYAMPLFLYKLELGSSIHPEHIDAIHRSNREGQWDWWQQQGCNYNVTELLNYDPYLGRVSNPESQQ